MKALIASLAITLALFTMSDASAEFLSAQQLKAAADDPKPEAQMFFIAYTAGVFDAGMGQAHCAPQSVSPPQVIALAKGILEQVPPEKLKEMSADMPLMYIFNKSWPCKSV